MVEQIPGIDEKEVNPPADAVSLSGKQVIGVNPKPLQTNFPEWAIATSAATFSRYHYASHQTG
jgi:hypothetical protein